MRYNFLGNTGLRVSELCLGAMTFGGRGFWTAIGQLDQGAASDLVGRALDAGVNFFDTADVYSEGESEKLLGAALGARRKDVVLATKVRGRVGPGPNDVGLSRGHIMASVEGSLRRLGTDWIDLYQIHGFDAWTPLEETVRALDDLVRQGKVRYAGASNLAAWQLMKALGLADARGLARFQSLQAYYTIAGRDLEREIVPLLEAERVGLMVWSPLAGGLLSGKFSRDGGKVEGARRTTFDFPPVDRDRAFACVDAMREVAQARGGGVTVAQVAIAWLLHRPVVTSVIIGAKRLDQLDENLAAADLRLEAAELEKLDRASALPPEYPGWMIERQGADRLKPAPR
ncbi:MAG TPA: aldo/keto reductase [Planctomycetota bacterium]|nr:aldo/keto reductase [Planctomycetota bacterium]